MSSASRVLAAALGVLPPSVIRRAARRYLGGATVAEAVDVARTFAKNGMSVTLAVVGEAATTPASAERYLHELLDIVATIDATTPDVRIGVKLTGLGLAFDANLASRNLHVIGTAVAEVGSIVEVDMEQACYVDQTLEIVRNTRSTLRCPCRCRYPRRVPRVARPAPSRRARSVCGCVRVSDDHGHTGRSSRPAREQWARRPRHDQFRCRRTQVCAQSYRYN